ncbi:unnamed protein product [Euphydryas editha]|uniref:Retrotransposon gag domain-containing protein n=1 Tax=Euphydryas editha TaxID=104508 RepID=A0AAU9UW67_EUPED|nr:unnamed protein product [Euphydryas editha]
MFYLITKLTFTSYAKGDTNGKNKESPSPVGSTTFAGNFSKCTSRFKGDRNDPEIVEAFVDAIETYKECTNISDIHALKGFPMLLEGEAAVWWRGVKASVTTWQDAIARLRAMFGVPRAPHKILRQIFSVEQGSERAEVFVARIRALIAWLPYKIEERMQLDIVYGLLDRSIRKRLARDTLTSLVELVDKARAIEETLAEVDSSSRKSAAPSSARAQSSTSAQQAHSSRSTRAFILCARTTPVERRRRQCRRIQRAGTAWAYARGRARTYAGRRAVIEPRHSCCRGTAKFVSFRKHHKGQTR